MAPNTPVPVNRMIRRDGLIDIYRDYSLKKYSSASGIVETVKGKLSKDRKLRGRNAGYPAPPAQIRDLPIPAQKASMHA